METKKFKCKDEVIYRCLVEYGNPIWSYGIFSHYEQVNNITYAKLVGVTGVDITKWEILPYEGNEHLVGTTDETDEEVRLEEGEYIMVFLRTQNLPFDCCLRKFKSVDEQIKAQDDDNYHLSVWPYCIKFSDFNPNDMEETKKHILVVKNGKIVRYKG